MHRFTKTCLGAALLAAAGSAAAEVTGNVALSSDYVWRGISQTDNAPAISGGFDYAHDSGFYAGTWGSNVDFGSDASVEIDGYFGFTNELSNGLGYDVGFVRYFYPSESELNFNEVYLGASYSYFNAKLSLTDDFGGSDDSAWRFEVGGAYEFEQGFSVSANVGTNDGDYFDGGDDYIDYSLGASTTVGGVDLGLTYTDTDADGCGNICDGAVVFSVSKSL